MTRMLACLVLLKMAAFGCAARSGPGVGTSAPASVPAGAEGAPESEPPARAERATEDTAVAPVGTAPAGASQTLAAAEPATPVPVAAASGESRPAKAASPARPERPVDKPGARVAFEGSPCKRTTKGDSPVVKACARGGVREAKTVMKDMVKQGRSAGVRFDCDDCHQDERDFAKLTADAAEKFRKLLAAYR
jgi:hypothetical protein